MQADAGASGSSTFNACSGPARPAHASHALSSHVCKLLAATRRVALSKWSAVHAAVCHGWGLHRRRRVLYHLRQDKQDVLGEDVSRDLMLHVTPAQVCRGVAQCRQPSAAGWART